MSGLDNIVEEIRNQSKQEADEILKEADVFCKDYMNKIKKENLLYRKAIPCSRLFLRKEKTREQAKEVLMLSDSYKSEEDIERELDFIYSAPLEILEDEYKRKIHLFHKLGFVLSDSVPIS